MNPGVKKVAYRSPYQLHLWFANGAEKLFSLQTYLDVPVYQKLRNEVFASKAFCFNGTVAWSDMIDFDPDTLFLESKPLKKTSIFEH